jgi:hypothetical protein
MFVDSPGPAHRVHLMLANDPLERFAIRARSESKHRRRQIDERGGPK